MLQPKPDNATPTMDVLPQQTPMAPETSPMEEAPGITPEEIEAHLDALPDQDKAFLAEHLTPEFVRAIGLISGSEVAQFLNQFADQSKVLVPVPRQMAEQYLSEQNSQAAPAQPQGQPMAPAQPSQPTQAPAGGVMTPKF